MTTDWTAVSHGNCRHVRGPFYHGTNASLSFGDVLTTGYASHFDRDRMLKHVYFSAMLESAIWGAELATALSRSGGRGYVYIVEPTGPFEDDPNLTNKRFPGNPTRSYRTCAPLKITGVVEDWEGHSPESLQAMLDSLAELKRRGLAAIIEE